MEYNEIKNLLEKYFDGSTSVQEENDLKFYFSRNYVHQDFSKYQDVFNYYQSEEKLVTNQEFLLKNKAKNKIWFSIAASLLLIASLSTLLYNKKIARQNEGLGTYQNPEIAFKETQKALRMISQNVNLGVESLAFINEYQKTKNKIFIE